MKYEMGRRIALRAVGLFFLLHTSCFILPAKSQDLFMRRTNSVGNWTAYFTNNGALFTQAGIVDVNQGRGGAVWSNGGGFPDTVVYGAGLWIGGLRRRSGILTPHSEYTYNP